MNIWQQRAYFAWIYCILVIHDRFISSEKPRKLISNLEKMCAERCAATDDLLNLSGRLRLTIAQVEKDAKDVSAKNQDSASALSDEEEEEELMKWCMAKTCGTLLLCLL